jgi:hypothetical protein
MSDLVQRPRFFEGQVLAADDLAAGLDYSRAQAARHNRLAHDWGLVDGLDLIGTAVPGSAVFHLVVTVSPGLAIDGTGREIVVPQEIPVEESLFLRSGVAVADPDALYPVLLAGADSPALPRPFTHRCGVAQAGRTVESYALTFGAPGTAAAVDRQTAPRVDQGAGGAPGQPRWWLLLGFVGWNAATRRFSRVVDRADGVSRRHVRVRADELTAQGGSLTLRASRAGTAGAAMAALETAGTGARLTVGVDDGHGGLLPRSSVHDQGTFESGSGRLTLRSGAAGVEGKPIVRLDETPGGGTLTFGLADAAGEPSRLLTVDEHGNLAIAGIFTGPGTGAVKVTSGTASDGVVLPLPEGVTEAHVARGEIAVHVLLTPRSPGRAPADADLERFPVWIGTPIAASVGADRRVSCRVQWVGLRQAGGEFASQVLAGSCDYVVLAVPTGHRRSGEP